MDQADNHLSLERFLELLDILVTKIQADPYFRPDTILALSTGGMIPAAFLAKRLKISGRYVVSLSTYKDETGDYHLGNELTDLRDLTGRHVLVVDDSSNRGHLIQHVVTVAAAHGAVAESAVLVAWQGGIQPDFVATTSNAKPPRFFWEIGTE